MAATPARVISGCSAWTRLRWAAFSSGRARCLPCRHADSGLAVPFLARRTLRQRRHRLAPRLPLRVGDHGHGDQLGVARDEVPDLLVTRGREEPMVERRLDLAATRRADADDLLAPRPDDPLHPVGTDLPVRPHGHQLGRLQPVGLREPDPLAPRQDHPRVAGRALVEAVVGRLLVGRPQDLGHVGRGARGRQPSKNSGRSLAIASRFFLPIALRRSSAFGPEKPASDLAICIACSW